MQRKYKLNIFSNKISLVIAQGNATLLMSAIPIEKELENIFNLYFYTFTMYLCCLDFLINFIL